MEEEHRAAAEGRRSLARAGVLLRASVASVPVIRLLPSAALAAAALVLLVTPPDDHYGLLVAVLPFLAAAVHAVPATAVIGALFVALFASLRLWRAEDDTAVALIKLGLVSTAAVLAVLVSQARFRERRLTRAQDIALALQEGLLPRAIPHSSAVDVSHRYVPTDTEAGVGGDWFDVIRLSGARVALVMGDVVGHGVHAAATMGRLRTAVRTLADLDPADSEDDVAVMLARVKAVPGDRVATWRLPPDARSVSAARAAAAAQLAAWGLDKASFTTELVVSELVTNAVRHASAPICLRLIMDDALICEVSDGSSTAPHMRLPRLTDEGGRGLYLCGRLATRWGTRYTGTGKTIWVEQTV